MEFEGLLQRFLLPLDATSNMEKIEEQFANLNIVKRSLRTKEPTYLLGIDTSKTVQAEKGSLAAVLCSNGSIRIYDKETLNILREFSGYPGILNGVKFANSHDSVYSSCTDGTVKCWDARLASEKPVQLFKGYPSNIFISFDINCDDHVICAGTEKVDDDALLVFWDARINSQDLSATKDPLGAYSETHSDDITQDESLLTGGEDEQLLLWKPGAVEKTLTKKGSMKIASSVYQRVRVHDYRTSPICSSSFFPPLLG
ncbi:WD repeat-containing protein 89 [Manis javanica]|nr:WD repeat-containing protein 89 [Manis javanica]